jgi:GNAT superfamily N-acetyltransferase
MCPRRRPASLTSMSIDAPPAIATRARSTSPRLRIRPATSADLPVLHGMAARAVHELLRGQHWSSAQVDAGAAIRIYEVEPELVHAGTHYVAEIDGQVVAGSGWSEGGPLLPDHGLDTIRPVADAATAVMRASYVDPRWARRGLATLLAHTTETAATIAGFRRFEALCTPPSEALRRSLGYQLVARVAAPLAAGVTVTGAHMRKQRA